MAYAKRVKKAFNMGKKNSTTAKKRKSMKGGLKLAKKIDKGIGKFAQKAGAKAVVKGLKTKNKKMVKRGAKSVGVGTATRAKGAGLRTAARAGSVYRMTAAHKKAIGDALRGKKRK